MDEHPKQSQQKLNIILMKVKFISGLFYYTACLSKMYLYGNKFVL